MPKSITSTPRASAAARAASSRANGYAPVRARTGESCTLVTLAGGEDAERLVGARELGRLDLLVGAVGVAGRARAEVDRVEAALGELRDGSPRLLRLDGEAAGRAQPLDERVVERDSRRRRVAGEHELDLRREKRPDALERLLGGAAGRIADVQRDGGLAGDDVVGDPARDPGRSHRLA